VAEEVRLSFEETRPNLGAVLAAVEKGECEVIVTDGRSGRARCRIIAEPSGTSLAALAADHDEAHRLAAAYVESSRTEGDYVAHSSTESEVARLVSDNAADIPSLGARPARNRRKP